jgi:squalene cyclase
MLSGNATEGTGGSARLEASIDSATLALLDDQRPDGHWFELEADCTILTQPRKRHGPCLP